MPRMPKTKSTVLKWFNIEKYELTSNLTPSEWYINLWYRHLFINGAMDLFSDYSFDDLANNPIVTETKKSKQLQHLSSISPPTNNNICQLYKKLLHRVPTYYFEMLNDVPKYKDISQVFFNEDESNENDSESKTHAQRWNPIPPPFLVAEIDDIFDLKNENSETFEFLKEPYAGNDEKYQGSAVISIDLLANDNQIKEDFSIWLKNKRESLISKVNKFKFNNNDFNEWAEFGILPYLDLTIWAQLNNNRITQAEMGRLIFPERISYDIDITERIRKVTRVKASELMNSDTLHALKLHAYS